MSERILSYPIKDLIVGRKEPVFLPGFGELTVIRPGTSADVVDVSGGLLDNYYTNRKQFNHAVVAFGNLFDSMKGDVIPLEERWRKKQSTSEEVTVLENNLAMDNLTRIANTPGAYENQDLKREYRRNLRGALETIKASQLLDSDAQRVAVKRAGVVVAEFLHEPNRALVYEAKRLPFIDGTLGVGIEDRDRVLTVENLNGQALEVDEVFLASGSTILALMIDSYIREIRPERLTVVAPFTTQQGAKVILGFSEKIGWDTRILTNRIYYALNKNLYVLVTPEEPVWKTVSCENLEMEVQAGGDAGDLTEI